MILVKLCRRLTAVTAVAGALVAAPVPAADYPQKGKPIQLLVAYAAGGPVDVGARVLAPALEKDLGTTVIVVNKPGASGQLAYTTLTHSKPDGYTIGTVGCPSTNVTYLDPARQATYGRKDFQLIGLHVIDPNVIAVRPDSPFKTLKDLVEYAKANPRKLRISTTGIQSDEAFALLQFEKLSGAKFAQVHFAQGQAAAMPAFLGAKVEVFCGNVGDLLGQYKRGEIRILGVMDSKRSSFYPDVKTFEEQGYKLYAASSRGFATPSGTPPEVVARLAEAMRKASESEEHRQKMADMGLTMRFLGPVEYAQYWNDHEEKLKELLPLMKESKEQ